MILTHSRAGRVSTPAWPPRLFPRPPPRCTTCPWRVLKVTTAVWLQCSAPSAPLGGDSGAQASLLSPQSVRGGGRPAQSQRTCPSPHTLSTTTARGLHHSLHINRKLDFFCLCNQLIMKGRNSFIQIIYSNNNNVNIDDSEFLHPLHKINDQQ